MVVISRSVRVWEVRACRNIGGWKVDEPPLVVVRYTIAGWVTELRRTRDDLG